MSAASDVPAYWDPYDREVCADPYARLARLREEMPLYYNDKYDFYALTRYDDVMAGLADRDTFQSGRGDIMEQIKANIPPPSGVFIHEDPPRHTIHRGIVTRVFTPKKMTALESQIRDFCARALDPLKNGDEFDFVKDLGAVMPMKVISMLIGIPEEDQEDVRQRADAALRTEAGKPMEFSEFNFFGEGFEDYIEWRVTHPSDDLMTQLLNAEFEDENGITRKLMREEILVFINILAGAGNETTNRLIGWMGKVLGAHPDQRRQIADDPALIPQTVEEVLRYEPPGPQIARYVSRDVEYHGQTVPEGSVMQFLLPAANRDPRKFVDGERFDIHRERVPHLTFGHGFHVCIGSALARVEGRVALDEILKRFRDWEVDLENAQLSSTSTVRGFDSLPTFINGARPKPGRKKAPAAQAAEASAASAPQIAGADKWKLVLSTPMGPQEMTAQLLIEGDTLSGAIASEMGSERFTGQAAGNKLTWTMNVTKPMAIKLDFDVTVDGDSMSGNVKLGVFGEAALSGERIP